MQKKGLPKGLWIQFQDAAAYREKEQLLLNMLADSDVGASKGGLFDDSKTLSKLIGRPTTTLAESVSHLFNVNN